MDSRSEDVDAGGEGTSFVPWQEVTVLDVVRDIATVKVHSEPPMSTSTRPGSPTAG